MSFRAVHPTLRLAIPGAAIPVASDILVSAWGSPSRGRGEKSWRGRTRNVWHTRFMSLINVIPVTHTIQRPPVPRRSRATRFPSYQGVLSGSHGWRLRGTFLKWLMRTLYAFILHGGCLFVLRRGFLSWENINLKGFGKIWNGFAGF